MEESHNKLPKSALALYVKLYCKKIGSSRNKQHILMEATKSWVSLSKAERQYFFNVFKDYEKKKIQKFATNLQIAQPYMKKHVKNVRCKSHTDFFTTSQDVTHDTLCLPSTVNDEKYEQNIESKAVTNSTNEEVQNDYELFKTCSKNIDLQTMHRMNESNIPRYISEPMPPIRSSMELFEIIKNNNDEPTRNVSWTDLSKTQKRRYQRAVMTIKNNYLKQYTAFLEQLTPEQLFQHYKSKF